MKKPISINSARELASFGFKHGFDCAVAWVDGLAQQAEDPEIRRVAALIAKILPESEKAAHDAFLESVTVLRASRPGAKR
jgi:hypothetical protein